MKYNNPFTPRSDIVNFSSPFQQITQQTGDEKIKTHQL